LILKEINMTKPLIFIIILLIFNTLSQGQDYPVTKKTTVLDTIFGEEIRDDYRWLENLDAADVEEWVSQQNEYTVKALKKLHKKRIHLLQLTNTLIWNIAILKSREIIISLLDSITMSVYLLFFIRLPYGKIRTSW